MNKLLLIPLLLTVGCGARCKPPHAMCHYDAAKYGQLAAPRSRPYIQGHTLQYAYRVPVGTTLRNAQGGRLGPMPPAYPCSHWEVFSYISPDDPAFKTNLVRIVADDDPDAACDCAPAEFFVP